MSDSDANEFEIPKWDPALESLVKDEYRRKQEGLVLQDFLDLARQHAIRFDDIMVTVFELGFHGEWQYRQADGTPLEITREMIEKRYVNGRLQEKDLQDFTGSWMPR